MPYNNNSIGLLIAYRAYATSMTSVCLSVCLQRWWIVITKCNKSGSRPARERIGHVVVLATVVLPASGSRPEPRYPVTTISTEEDHLLRKNVEFCTATASNGSHVALSQHVRLCDIVSTMHSNFPDLRWHASPRLEL